MKNESSIGQNFKFITYTIPQIKDENLSKVKIELETGTLIHTKNQNSKIASIVKPQTNLISSLNNIMANKNTSIKQETPLPEKSSSPHPSNKLNCDIRPNDISYYNVVKKEEDFDFNNIELPSLYKKNEFKQDSKVEMIKNQYSKPEIKFNQKKRKKEISVINYNILSEGDNRIGRWTKEEHRKFIDAICKFGNEWKKVQQYIKTRSSTQARSHAQKFFLRLKKKFNLSNKDSESSIAELAKLPEDIIINYIKECTNTDANINIEEKDRLLNVLVNFANFNKKSKRKISKHSKDREISNSIIKNLNEDNIYFTHQNLPFKNDFLNNEENHLSLNNYNPNLSEENEEEVENESIKVKKIFKITKIPKVNEDISPLINNKINMIVSSNKSNKNLKTSNCEKDFRLIKEESINYSEKNTLSVSFNIKNDNLNKTPVSPKLNSNLNLDQIKNAFNPVNPDANNNNFNYINIMTINLCQPNMVNGTENKQVATKHQLPMSTFLNLNGNCNDINSNQIKNQIQQLINQNLLNIKTNANSNSPKLNSNNMNVNNKVINNSMNQNNLNIHSNLNQPQNNCINFQMQNNLGNNIQFIKNALNNNNNNYNIINSAGNEFIQLNNTSNNKINIGKQISNNKVILNNNNYPNNFNNISFINNNNNSFSQSNQNGKYDEIKNYYHNFIKTNNYRDLINTNTSSNNIQNIIGQSPNIDVNNINLNLEKFLQKAKNQIKVPLDSKSLQSKTIQEFLIYQSIQNQVINSSNQKPNVSKPLSQNIKQGSTTNTIKLINPVIQNNYNSSPYVYDSFPYDTIKKEDEENDLTNPFNLNFIPTDSMGKKDDDFDEDFWNLNK